MLFSEMGGKSGKSRYVLVEVVARLFEGIGAGFLTMRGVKRFPVPVRVTAFPGFRMFSLENAEDDAALGGNRKGIGFGGSFCFLLFWSASFGAERFFVKGLAGAAGEVAETESE